MLPTLLYLARFLVQSRFRPIDQALILEEILATGDTGFYWGLKQIYAVVGAEGYIQNGSAAVILDGMVWQAV